MNEERGEPRAEGVATGRTVSTGFAAGGLAALCESHVQSLIRGGAGGS